MSTELDRIKSRRRSFNELKKLIERAENAYVIHYSCESFFETKDGKSPRITSIAVRNLETAQSKSFSIHQYAEIMEVENGDIEEKYEEIEKVMLDNFFEFVRTHQGLIYVHWNMRNINYGFSALEHRYKVLGGEPHILEDEKKVDASRLMYNIYGRGYTNKGALVDLTELNHFNNTYFLSGADEAEAFTNGEYLKLHQSTLAKVDIIAYIVDLAAADSLKTRSSIWKQYGVHPKILIELIREHWMFGLASIAVLAWGLLRMFGVLP